MGNISFPALFFIFSLTAFIVVSLVRANNKKREREALFERNIASLPEILKSRYQACKVIDATWFNYVGNSLHIGEDAQLNSAERTLKEAWDAIDDAEELLREKDFRSSKDKLFQFSNFVEVAEGKFKSLDGQEELS